MISILLNHSKLRILISWTKWNAKKADKYSIHSPHRISTVPKSHAYLHNKLELRFGVGSSELTLYWLQHHHDLPCPSPSTEELEAYRVLSRSSNGKTKYSSNIILCDLKIICSADFPYQIHIDLKLPKLIIHDLGIVNDNVQSIKFADCCLECFFELNIISDITVTK